MTLVVMAAGMGSRYGGLKQLDPVGSHGEFILDYSVYDAYKSGFDKVVFVIKEENLELFRTTVGKRIEKQLNVEYAFQRIDDVPQGFAVPEGRVKPWGTAHAVLSAAKYVNEPFAAINADDFYGRESYKLLHDFLAMSKANEYCMAGYVLGNTLTENGSVARGICVTDENGILREITERTKIYRKPDGVVVWADDDGEHEVSENAVASMNCWGFPASFMESLRDGFAEFTSNPSGDMLKREFYLPSAVMRDLQSGKATVKVLNTDAKWYGVTYHSDREGVVKFLAKEREDGRYPEYLWN